MELRRKTSRRRTPPSSLGTRIRTRRKELGLTQSQLGGKDLSKGFISLVETGRTRPSIETLMLVARRLRQPVGFFLDDDAPLSEKALRSLLASGWVALKRGEFTPAAEVFRQAQGIARHYDRAVQAECCIGLASALAGLRQLDLARRNVDQGKVLAEASGNRHLLVSVHHVLGLIAYYGPDFSGARQHFQEGYRLLRKVGHPDLSLAGSLLFNIGNTYEDAGDHGEAARWYREAVRALEPTEDLHRIGVARVQLGVAYRQNGNHEAALEELTRAEHIFELLNARRLLAQARNSIGITLLEQGKTDEAITQLRNSLRLKEMIGDDAGRARSLTEIARALIAKRAFEEAEQTLDAAASIAKNVRDAAEGARIMLVRGRMHREIGRLPEAVKNYKGAIEAFERLGMRAFVAEACKQAGDVLLQQKRASEAAPYLARALRAWAPPQKSGTAKLT